MTSRIALRRLLFDLVLILVLIAASVPAGRAQDTISPAKHAAIRKLIEVSGMRRYMVAAFDQMLTRNQEGWPGPVIADFKAKGLFKPLTAEDAAKMEKVIYEFSEHVFGETKRRVALEIITTDNLESLTAQTYDKYFTEDELNALAAFCQTEAGKKFLDEYARVLTKAMMAHLEAKGAFTTLASPEADLARAERLEKEITTNPSATAQQILAGRDLISPEHFTEDEIRELREFSKTPLGRKLAEVSQTFTTEVMAQNSRSLALRVEKLAGEVFAAQMEDFQQRTREIFKNYDASGRRREPAPE